MRKHKLLAGLTAFACTATLLAAMPLNLAVSATELVSNDFEQTYEGWCNSSDAVTLAAMDGAGVEGSRGMVVGGRTSASDGAYSYKGFYLTGGTTNTYRVMVYAETDQTFRMTVAVKDEATDAVTEHEIASKHVKGGKWTELSGDWKAPRNSYDFKLTITTDSTDDFRFDDVCVVGKQPQMTARAADAGLKNVYGKYFRVGNILNGGTVRNSAITANVIQNYSSIECENETKPDATLVKSQCSGTNIGVSLNSCAAIADFCVKNNIGFRGHAFVWHSQTPSWFFKTDFNNGNWVDSKTMDARLESYIKNMFAAFAQQYPTLDLYSYDVCNECVSDDSNRTANNGGAREPGDNNVSGGKSAWVQVYGDNSFVEHAFTYARKYAPATCKLYYNDYNEYWDHKRDCIINTIVKPLYEKNLLDGMGMQSHVPANATGFAGTDVYIDAMKRYLAIGCDVQITELDISVDNGKYSYDDQATKYAAIFQAAMDWNKNPQSTGRVTAVNIWGPNDANSWLKAGSNALLFDSNNQPKAAYNKLMTLVPQSEWVADADLDFGGGGGATTIEPNEYGWFFQNGFESDTETWSGRGAATVAVSGDNAYVGDKALAVTGRTASWNGASRSLNARAFVPGEEFSFSVNVKYDTGAATDTFHLTLQYEDAAGETQYVKVDTQTVPRGQWVQLANTNFKIPEDASNMQLYVETEDSTTSFYIDEAIGAVGGTGILGAGAGKQAILGDVNCDGKLDARDLSAGKRGMQKGFTDTMAELNADVDQSGVVDATDMQLLRDYLLTKITEFPVAQRVVDFTAMEAKFSGLSAEESWKLAGENNTLWTQRFGADPGFMVYKDRLYVYTTNDAFEYDGNGQMKENSYNVQTINCYSSADLVNWTDHGAIPVAGRNNGVGAAKWASFSWAPDACWKTINGKDKFFLYFADSAGGIGVLTADSPEGPYTDPIGKALINKSTPGYGDVTWLFDPAVLVDDDGKGYLYCGGGVPEGKAADPGTARVIQLGDDMTSLSGSCAKINPPYLFEDSSILKIGNTYYYSYCTNWSTGGNPYGFNNADIAVMTATNPMGPFTYQGVVFKNPASYKIDGGGNNHHSIVEFKGKYYVLYHSRVIERRMGVNGGSGYNYRSCHLNEATFSNGKLSATLDMKGVSQIETLNPYTTVQAETMASQSKGISVSGLCDTTVEGKKGSWFKVAGVACGSNAKSLTMKASSANGAVIKVCTGSASGTAVTYVEIPAGGQVSEITVPVVGLTGTQDLYFVYSDAASVDAWSLK